MQKFRKIIYMIKIIRETGFLLDSCLVCDCACSRSSRTTYPRGRSTESSTVLFCFVKRSATSEWTTKKKKSKILTKVIALLKTAGKIVSGYKANLETLKTLLQQEVKEFKAGRSGRRAPL